MDCNSILFWNRSLGIYDDLKQWQEELKEEIDTYLERDDGES